MCILSVSYLLNSDCSIMFLTNLTMQPTTISFLQFFSCCLLSHSSFALDLILLSLAHLGTLAQSTWPALSGSLTLAAINQSNHRTWPPFLAATPVLDAFCSYGSLMTVNYCIKHVK